MKQIATLIATAAFLVLPATAFADVVKQEGFIKGDKAAAVKLRVKVVGGNAKKVAGFRAKNVVANCNGKKKIRISLTALAPVKVKRDDRFKVRLGDGEGGILRISGEVENRGQATVGNLKTNEFESGKLTCKVSKQGFATSAR